MLDLAQTDSSDGGGAFSAGEWRAMLQAASQVNDWQGSLKLLARLARPYVEAYAYAITACGRANQPTRAHELLDALQAANLQPPTRAYNQVISAYARGGQWESALKLLDTTPPSMRTVVSYNAALSACSSARPARWSEALDLLSRMEADGPTPDVVSYSTAAAACQHAKQWEPYVKRLGDEGHLPLSSSALVGALPSPLLPSYSGPSSARGVSA